MTPSQVRDELDIPMLESLYKHWKRYPPINEMIACYFDIPGTADRRETGMDENGMTLFDMFPEAEKKSG